jgi:siroheme synthase
MEIRWNLPGKVYLVAAGPGSARQLTARAVEVLQKADIVFHDDLVSSDVLEMVPSRTAVYKMGTRPEAERVGQDELNQRMISAARSGQTVVLVKSGGPLIFAGAEQEIGALREAGIDFEVMTGLKGETEEVIELFRAEASDADLRPGNNIHV